jgi:protein disulfide-isomerase
MRLSLISLLSAALLPFLISSVGAADSTDDADADDTPQSTTFNGVEVPPMKILSGQSLDEDISKGNWYVLCDGPDVGLQLIE